MVVDVLDVEDADGPFLLGQEGLAEWG